MTKKGVKSTKAIDLLLENTIALQKTITNLATELKSLNKKVSSLLKLFEDASKAFKEARIEGAAAAPSEIAELSEKIDDLVKQNMTIAKGLLLLEKTLRESKVERPSPARPSRETHKPKPLPEFSF
ncbi:MAG: hypothetical protein IB618_01645 [Candidatus Pacearchaeota archaeon]|nr:MAG: hypothetical protein IB618_01645 [Candidatus Pacearchaeota archaeon]